MNFLKRHKWTYLVGIVVFIGNIFFVKIVPNNIESLMSAVLALAATLTAIFVGFVSIVLSFKNNNLFRTLELDLSILESLMLGTVFYLSLSFISLAGFFLKGNKSHIIFMSFWFLLLFLSFGITLSLIIQLFQILKGLWMRRKNEDDLYK